MVNVITIFPVVRCQNFKAPLHESNLGTLIWDNSHIYRPPECRALVLRSLESNCTVALRVCNTDWDLKLKFCHMLAVRHFQYLNHLQGSLFSTSWDFFFNWTMLHSTFLYRIFFFVYFTIYIISWIPVVILKPR